MGSFTQRMGLESFGSLGLLAGFLTRFAVASLAVIMLGAIRRR